MMRTFPKGYLAPWSNRREKIGLMGTFIVFLLGLPTHSETMIESARHTVAQVIRLFLVFFGLSTPVVQAPVASVVPAAPSRVAIHHPASAAVIKDSPKADLNSMQLRTDPLLFHFTYIFEGKATWHDAPCPNASVLVRLVSGERTMAKGAVTNPDGSYSLEVAIDAQDKSPVDWVIEAYTADFKPVELSGRKIVQREDESVQQKQPIIVNNPVAFVLTLSK